MIDEPCEALRSLLRRLRVVEWILRLQGAGWDKPTMNEFCRSVGAHCIKEENAAVIRRRRCLREGLSEARESSAAARVVCPRGSSVADASVGLGNLVGLRHAALRWEGSEEVKKDTRARDQRLTQKREPEAIRSKEGRSAVERGRKRGKHVARCLHDLSQVIGTLARRKTAAAATAEARAAAGELAGGVARGGAGAGVGLSRGALAAAAERAKGDRER